MKNRYWWLNQLTNRSLAEALTAACNHVCPFWKEDGDDEPCQCKCDCITEVAIWLGEEHKE